MLFCTISTANHLPKAACLAKSLLRTQAEHQFLLCLVERDDSAIHQVDYHFPRVILASNLNIPNFDSFIFSHTAFEACMAVKADILMWAMLNYTQEQFFVYLDSDTFAYSRFEELEAILSRSEIVLTPHHVHDEIALEAIWDQISRTLTCGTFNSGFLALRHSQIALQFLEWWSSKLRIFCYRDPSHGLYYEQKWLDLILSYFEVTIFREPGYNVANWNISQRSVTLSPDSCGYIVNGKPLRFFHFSMIDSGKDMFYFSKYLEPDSAVFELRDRYCHDIRDADRTKSVSQKSWSYETFTSGEHIAPEARSFFRSDPGFSKMFSNPFEESNFTIISEAARSLKRSPNR